MENFQRVGPVALLLVNAQQMIQCGVAVLAGCGQLFQQPLRAVHEAGAEEVECESECGLIAQGTGALLSQARMNGNGAINFTAAAKEAADGELDFRSIAVCLSHARENLGSVVKAVVDQVVEADVVIAGQTDRPRRAIAAP